MSKIISALLINLIQRLFPCTCYILLALSLTNELNKTSDVYIYMTVTILSTKRVCALLLLSVKLNFFKRTLSRLQLDETGPRVTLPMLQLVGLGPCHFLYFLSQKNCATS